VAAVLLRDAVPPLDERAHEAAVAAFLKSTLKRERERASRRHPVLSDYDIMQIVRRESCWAGDVLDELLVDCDPGTMQRLEFRGCLPRTPTALNLGGRVFTDEIGEEARASRPGDAAIWRPTEA
jgi:hypothetical protein